MRMKTAIKELWRNYDRAMDMEFIIKPISWALYQTWRWCDSKEKPRIKAKNERVQKRR